MKQTLIFIFLFGLGVLPAWAELKLSPLFSDHMVLQREQAVPVWGTANPGETITVRFAEQEKKTTADAAGKWQVKLDPLRVNSQPQELVVAGDKAVTVKDVLVGDVWVCAGQSNMEFPLFRTDTAAESSKADYPNVRHFQVARASADVAQESVVGEWQPCQPLTAKGFTAVGYYFGRDLHLSQKIPIGLMNNSVGGTRAQLWLPTSALHADPVLKPDAEEDLRQKIAFCSAVRDASAAAGKWVADVESARAGNKPLPPMPSLTVPPSQMYYAGYLYNGMVAPLTRFPIKGVIWYQGESNTYSFPAARQYRQLLTALIGAWRGAWGIGDFPFYIVQLHSFGTTDAQNPWAEVRESQRLVARQVSHSGLVVTTDLGEAGWHPLNKRDVGRRLALLARSKTYGEAVAGSGPEYESMKVVGQEVVLTFAPQSGPLVAKGGELKHFTIAGADRKFVAATAKIEGNTVMVSSDKVTAPVVVRYAWAGNPEGANLFNAAGLPASPFQTDEYQK